MFSSSVVMMDIRHQISFYLACLMCLNPVFSMDETVYCTNQLGRSPAINVCQQHTITGSEVYIDSSGAPVGDEISCKCILDSTARPVVLVEITYETNAENDDIQFVVSGFNFERKSGKREITVMKPTEIIFRKKMGVKGTAGCLGFEYKSERYTENGPNLTITCLPENKETDKNAQRIASLEDKNDAPSSIGVIVGVVGGGCVITIIVVAAIVFIRRRKRNLNPAISSTNHTIQTTNGVDNYVITDNYESAMPSIRRKPSGAYTEIYEVVEDPNPKHVYDTTAGLEYNHISEVKSHHNTDNVYNKLNQHSNISNKSGEDVDSEYNHTNDIKHMKTIQTGNVYDKSH